MEITGRVIAILPEYTTGSGKKKFSFVIETSGQYPQKVPFEVWGEEKWGNMRVQEGASVVVSFDVSGREYQGKYFVSLNAWKVMRTDGQQGQQSVASQPAVQAETVAKDAPAPESSSQVDGGLPF